MITREEYMSGELTKETHDRYYKEFLTPNLVQFVGDCIGFDKIKGSTNKHFNDIPLRNWDAIVPNVLNMSYPMIKKKGEDRSVSTGVCIAKAAAKFIRDGETL